ncbi:MAG TPA: alpha/beta fold hydrolase [Actinophytocola sp.]|jgi:triacylglycerol esterase/lipase EstA (alpha/beta hydrolase family)|uniref:esterase/lipase family protein n=1 Tax=Actinophytocola sp. TaxID=1872138 RepID=UPI002E077700|nr:alpha/beta fold hydrolase [Actinophytocola sp.]
MQRRIALLLSALICTLFAAPALPAAAAAPNPVIIVNGTFGPAFFYEPLAARLRHDGYQVSIFELTNLGTGDIAGTARDFAAFVDGVRARTGAARVDLVAHSQGGLVARQYIRFNGGSSTVDKLVNLAAPNQGTAIANIAAFFGLGNCLGIVACQQMAVGSPFLATLNAGDDTPGAVRYTNLYTLEDELVRPVANAALHDGAVNVLIQSQCPLRIVDHIGLALDGTTYDGVHDALRGAPISLNCFAI